MSRTLLTTATNFYANPSTGSLSNDGLSAATPLPQIQDVIDRLYASYDLGGQQVAVIGADSQNFNGFTLTGQFVGQRGPSFSVHIGSAYGLSQIVPQSLGAGVNGSCGVCLNYDATLALYNATIDSTQQLGAGSLGNDCIALGQNAKLQLFGMTKLIQNTVAFNHMTLDSCCTVDVVPAPSGHLRFAGHAQCGIQLDASSAFQSDCNFTHGLIAFWADTLGGNPPYWADAFVDVATGSKALIAGTDFHGAGLGYRYRIREGGVLDLNLANDPRELAAMFGSADTAWAVQGYLV